jgi:superfamily I DNA and RNA helicase
MLNFIDAHKKATIRGCAGAGKSILAVKKAKRLAKRGNEVLFLVFNKLIAKRVAKECEDYENIKVTHFHGLCLETLGVSKKETSEFWNVELPEMFFEHLIANPMKFDAVIVDEAQDFREGYWDSIPDLVKKDGWFYIFYDPDQNLFDTKLKIPDLGEEFLLTTNCRNSHHIFDEIKNMASVEIFSADTPEGAPVEKYSAKSANDARNILSKILYDLIENESVPNSNIVILGAHHMPHSSIGDDCHIKTFTIVEKGELSNNKCVEYHTLYSFKGCDSDVVIILDYNKNDKLWANGAALYTAMSRAIFKLCIIEKNY